MMIQPHHRRILFFAALAVSASLGFTALRADDDDDEQGGDINGSESMNIEINMTPTADAPAGSSIIAVLKAEDAAGVTNAKLKLKEQGLPDGTYSVSVTLKSDGSAVALGSFNVAAATTPTPGSSVTPTPTPTASPSATPHGDDGDDDDDDDNQGDDDDQGDDGHHGCEFGNGTSLPFPAGFNPMDIATISVSDSNGVVLFTADLTNTGGMSTLSFTANVLALPGANYSGANGTGTLTVAGAKGKSRGSLQLTVHGLPSKMPVTFAVNGSPVKNLVTDKKGNANVSLGGSGKKAKLPKGLNLLKVTSVGLHDKTGQLIVGASF
jgi:hypothetical protein